MLVISIILRNNVYIDCLVTVRVHLIVHLGFLHQDSGCPIWGPLIVMLVLGPVTLRVTVKTALEGADVLLLVVPRYQGKGFLLDLVGGLILAQTLAHEREFVFVCI